MNEKFELALDFYKKNDLKNALDNLDVFDESFDSLALKALIYYKKKDNKSLFYILNTYPVLNEYKFLIKLLSSDEFDVDKNLLNYIESYNLGVFYIGIKKYEMALQCFLKSVEHKPDFIQGLNNAAIIFEILQNKTQTLEILLKAKNIDSLNGLIRINIWLSEHINVLESVKPLELDESFSHSNLTLIINYLMYYFYSTGEIKRAVLLSEKFITDSYYAKYIWHNRATILHKIGNRTQATSSYMKAILNFPNIYTIYNMHIATIELLRFSPKKAIERMILDYKDIDLIYFYSCLFFLRNRDLEESYLYIKKAFELNSDKYSIFLNILENSEDMSIEEILKNFVESLKRQWPLEYSFFINNSLNLKDPIFVFDYETRLSPYIWRIKEEHIELKNRLEDGILSQVLKTEFDLVNHDVLIREFKDLIEAYKEFKKNS